MIPKTHHVQITPEGQASLREVEIVHRLSISYNLLHIRKS